MRYANVLFLMLFFPLNVQDKDVKVNVCLSETCKQFCQKIKLRAFITWVCRSNWNWPNHSETIGNFGKRSYNAIFKQKNMQQLLWHVPDPTVCFGAKNVGICLMKLTLLSITSQTIMYGDIITSHFIWFY